MRTEKRRRESTICAAGPSWGVDATARVGSSSGAVGSFSEWPQSGALLHEANDSPRDRFHVSGAVKYVPCGRAGVGELPVHVPGGVDVGEVVSDPRAHPLDAQRLGWEQDQVVHRAEAGGGGEGLEEPRADHAVKDDGVATSGQPAGGNNSWRRCCASPTTSTRRP